VVVVCAATGSDKATWEANAPPTIKAEAAARVPRHHDVPKAFSRIESDMGWSFVRKVTVTGFAKRRRARDTDWIRTRICGVESLLH